jgi:hypothetical protein
MLLGQGVVVGRKQSPVQGACEFGDPVVVKRMKNARSNARPVMNRHGILLRRELVMPHSILRLKETELGGSPISRLSSRLTRARSQSKLLFLTGIESRRQLSPVEYKGQFSVSFLHRPLKPGNKDCGRLTPLLSWIPVPRTRLSLSAFAPRKHVFSRSERRQYGKARN